MKPSALQRVPQHSNSGIGLDESTPGLPADKTSSFSGPSWASTRFGLLNRVLASDWWGEVKAIDELLEQAESNQLKRTLGVGELTAVGVGGIIGTGIFVLTGTVAAKNAGPAVVLSFVVSGTAALFAALCYAELASIIPISGSAYTYTYATMGELCAWIIGWDLILEYLVGGATVAVGWSAYFVQFVEDCTGSTFDRRWCDSPIIWDPEAGVFNYTGHYINLPAMAISLVITFLLIRGVQESAKFNNVVVIIKVFVVLLFIFATCFKVDRSLWEPFIPPNTGQTGRYGFSGILQGATTVFFAYIGFDAVSTTAQECKNPQRDLPIGTILSLVVCTALYIAVSLIVTGLVPYQELNVANPISFAVQHIPGYNWLSVIISVGAIMGLTSVLLVTLMGQPRIFFSMAHDGLFSPLASKVHPVYQTPYITTAVTGVLCGIMGGFLPIDVLGELSSIGTLFAFFLVSSGVMVLRLRRPDLPRQFKVPGGPYLVPLLGATSSGLLICTATVATIYRLFIWMFIGLIIYYTYGRKNAQKVRDARKQQAKMRAYLEPSESADEFDVEMTKISPLAEKIKTIGKMDCLGEVDNPLTPGMQGKQWPAPREPPSCG